MCGDNWINLKNYREILKGYCEDQHTEKLGYAEREFRLELKQLEVAL